MALFAVLKKPNTTTCGILELQSGVDAGGTKLEFWVEVGEVGAGYAMAQSIVDKMNAPERPGRRKPATGE